jgi:hypothetical protein
MNLLFGQTLAVTYPNHPNTLAGFVVARNDSGQPYLVCYNDSLPRSNVHGPLMTQGDRFTCEGVPFKVDDDNFALSIGELTGKERSAIIPNGPARLAG